MNKKATDKPVKTHEPVTKKPAFVRDARGFIVKLPKPNKTQTVKWGL